MKTVIIPIVSVTLCSWSISCGERPKPRVPDAPVASATGTAPAEATSSPAPEESTAPEAPKAVVSSATDDPSTARCAGLTFTKPVTWGWITPTMQFRTLQYTVPGRDGEPAADLIFSVFPQNGAGPVDANLDRWTGQFRSAEGVEARSERSTFEVAGAKVSFIELEGSYAGMGAAAPRPGWAQLGVIIQTPGSDVFIRMLGPSETVLSNVDPFMDMVRSMTLD